MRNTLCVDTTNLRPVLISYHTPLWIKVGLKSFHQHFPEYRVLIVDNNPDRDEPTWDPACEEERAWLRQQTYVDLVKNERTDKTHGSGLDLAVAWCRKNEIGLMLHFEPDCLVGGRQWYENLVHTIQGGAWMAGPNTKSYGPIHPCPSLWRVDRIEHTFGRRPIREDMSHPRFSELFDVAVFNKQQPTVALENWKWDTGLKLWFMAAVNDKAVHVSKELDFKHFWCGTEKRFNHEAFYIEPDVFRLADPPNNRLLGYFFLLLRNPLIDRLLGVEARNNVRRLMRRFLKPRATEPR